MQIILTQEEIEQSIEAYVREQINIADNQKVSIDLKPTRGESGMTAILDIRSMANTPAKKTNTRSASKPTPVKATTVEEVIAKTSKESPEKESTPDLVEDRSAMDAAAPEEAPEASPATEVDEVASAIPDAPETEPAEAKPTKGSIFQFGNTAVGA